MFGGYRPGKPGWGAAGKVMVFGIDKRKGLVRVFGVNSRKREELLPLIERHTAKGCLYYTDNGHADATLGVRGNPVVVSQDKGIPKGIPKGRDHINGSEGFWSDAKNGLSPCCLRIVVCPKSSFLCIGPKLLSASTLASKTFTPCCLRL